ncbi:ABC transporter ATP-binding protein [Sedimentitalea todarodis]|uniref:ABC transporter ATP-binding protein n=1 Tax=Sedimentitalea todarodis TaxID=1631240 RepID=A0ABU3VGU3_9RHOB|nr:ABC transporter ATP-binding protein [Sedimentitalea todarodis]MDU9005308.1 ABC transporter ATP-binding protein [Sedimentitalea todarodis]
MSNPILDVRNATKRFGGLTAVNDVSFIVRRGELLGIAGPNGSGKSTLFNIVSRIPFGPTSGGIWFDGQQIDRMAPHKIAGMGLTRTFQKDVEFPDLTASETVGVAATYGKGLPRNELQGSVQQALDLVEFDPERRTMPTTELSVYQRKQLMIASALVMDPKVLMLDEPASGLTRPEISALEALLRKINATGITILLIEHVLSLLMAVSKRLIVLNQGALLSEGDPTEVMKDPAVVEAYLGTRAA